MMYVCMYACTLYICDGVWIWWLNYYRDNADMEIKFLRWIFISLKHWNEMCIWKYTNKYYCTQRGVWKVCTRVVYTRHKQSNIFLMSVNTSSFIFFFQHFFFLLLFHPGRFLSVNLFWAFRDLSALIISNVARAPPVTLPSPLLYIYIYSFFGVFSTSLKSILPALLLMSSWLQQLLYAPQVLAHPHLKARGITNEKERQP